MYDMAPIEPQVASKRKPAVASVVSAYASDFQPMVKSEKFDVGAALNALIARSGKQKLELAAHMGVSEQAVQKWIKQGKIAREHIRGICLFLNCSADELLGLTPFRDDGEQAPAGHSQTVRLDHEIVRGVARAMHDTAKELRVSLGIKQAVYLFAELYERVGESGITTADVVWMVGRIGQGASQDEGAGGVSDGSRDAAGKMGGRRKS